MLLTHRGQITAGEADWIWASAAKNPPSWSRALWETRGRWLIPLILLLRCVMAFTLKEVAIARIRRLDGVKHTLCFRGNSPQATFENLPLLPFVAYLHLTLVLSVRHRRNILKLLFMITWRSTNQQKASNLRQSLVILSPIHLHWPEIPLNTQQVQWRTCQILAYLCFVELMSRNDYGNKADKHDFQY